MTTINNANRTSNVNSVGYQGSDLQDLALSNTTSQVREFDSQARGIMTDINTNQRLADKLRKQISQADEMLRQLGDSDSGFVTGPATEALHRGKPDGWCVNPNADSNAASATDAVKRAFKLEGGVDKAEGDGRVIHLHNGKDVHVTAEGRIIFPDQATAKEFLAQNPKGVSGLQKEPVAAYKVTKEGLNSLKDNINDKMTDLNTRNETNNLQLQSIMHQRQEALELASALLKMMNQTTMSIIKNIA